MKKLNQSSLGIDQGNVELFSEFANGGEMWTGTGPRERRRTITFSQSFAHMPVVQVSLSLWDIDSETNVRADVQAENVTQAGFDMVFRTWADTRVARVGLSWIALGPVAHEDDWDLY